MNPFHLLIQTNSPGELISWVQPVVKAFKEKEPNSTISIYLAPCQYASGKEESIAKSIKGIDIVISSKPYIKSLWQFWKRKPLNGAVLYLGGDPFYAQWLGFKHHIPVYGYTEHKKKLGPSYKKTFFKHLDGDLMISRILDFKPDKTNIYEKYNLNHNEEYWLFFGGSRKQHFKHFVSFLSETVGEIKAKNKDFSPILLVSPFITDEELEKAKQESELSLFTILRGDSLELMSISKCLVTLPGTNTAEAMYMKLPMIVLIPLNKPDVIIFDGLIGILGSLPYLGTRLKKIVIFILLKKRRLYSLPNIATRKETVPEKIGILDPKEIANLIIDYDTYPEKLEAIKSNLNKIKTNESIANTIVNHILN